MLFFLKSTTCNESSAHQAAPGRRSGRFAAEKIWGTWKTLLKTPPLPLSCLTTKSLRYSSNRISKWGKTRERRDSNCSRRFCST